MSTVLSLVTLVSILLQTVVSQGGYKRVCYYTNWAQYRPKEGKYLPEDVDANLCTHIVYAFAKLKGNRLEPFEWNDDSTDWMKGMYNRLNDLKMKNPSLKTLLAVGGWNMASKPFTAMVATPASRREFATTSVQFLRDRKFDGLDLDWEYPANRGSPPEDKQRYSELVTEIRRAFDEDARRTGREPLLLTSAVAAGKDKIDTAYDIPSVCRDMDFISIMTYDLHGSWEDVTGHNSPLYAHSGETGKQRYLNMDWASNYWVQSGCPKHKLVIGLGLYGRSFTLRDPTKNGLMAAAKGKGKAGKYTREGGFLAYYEICDMINKGAQSHYIKEQEAPYAVQNDLWVGYDDVDSLRIKVQWMKKNGFSGIMVWALDLDDFKGTTCGQGQYPLMNAINQELMGTSVVPPKTRPNRVQPDLSQMQTNENHNNNWNNNEQNAWEQHHQNYHHQPTNNWNQASVNTNVMTSPPTTPPANLPHLTNEFKCPPNENTYFPSPTSCEDYFICASGLSFKFTCSPPLKWNAVNNFCDWPENVQCNKKPVKTRPAPVPTKPAPIPTKPIPPVLTPSTRRPVPRRPPPGRRMPKRPTRQTTLPPTVPTTQGSFTQPTPPWVDWSAWIAEFWKALTSMTGGQSDWMKQTLQSAANQATSQMMGPGGALIGPDVPAIGPNVPPGAIVPPVMGPGAAPVIAPVPKKFCDGKNDGIHPDPTDCSKYVDCVQGRDYQGSCPSGTSFDATNGVCDYTHKISRCATQPAPAW
ncbi:chitotriosidase-1-like [Ruditapes philippinarum]|uniref:chitotriosidase-1-like n=1 Tax=Ruditapes philippinarum TaxID=129788 RepID=UPI00295A99FF|nr:chitotriosidase-1-like [Ruditapes philippinarum]